VDGMMFTKHIIEAFYQSLDVRYLGWGLLGPKAFLMAATTRSRDTTLGI